MSRTDLGKRRQRRLGQLVAVLVGAAAVVGSGGPAVAELYWAKKNYPLVASDNGVRKAAGAGRWTYGNTENGTRSKAYGYLKDLQANGKNVYFELFTWTNSGYCLQPDYTQCSAEYYLWASQYSNFDKETWDRNYWSPEFYASTSVNPSGDYLRAHMQVSESNSGPDTHSGFIILEGRPY